MSDITDKCRQNAQLMSGLARAADKSGTPVYVIDMVSADAAARQTETAFGGPRLPHYSPKANDLPAITRYLEGIGKTGAQPSAETRLSDLAPAPAGSPNPVPRQPATAQPRHRG